MVNNRISIIMPVYNLEETIKEAIDSVICQSFKNFELIIVDDGSNDETVKIIKKIQIYDERIRLFETNHLGTGYAKNYGLSKVTGQYVAFIDGDDLYDSDFLQKGYNKLIDCGADVVVYDYIRFYEDGAEEKETVGTSPFRAYTAVWNKIYTRRVWDGIEFPEKMEVEDAEVVPIVLLKASKIVKVNDCYYRYRQRKGSLTNRSFAKKSVTIVEVVNLLLKQMLEFEMPIESREVNMFVNSQMYTYMYLGMKSLNSRKDRQKVYLRIRKYQIKLKKKYFKKIRYSDSFLINTKNSLIMKLFALGQYNLGLLIADGARRIRGKAK